MVDYRLALCNNLKIYPWRKVTLIGIIVSESLPLSTSLSLVTDNIFVVDLRCILQKCRP